MLALDLCYKGASISSILHRLDSPTIMMSNRQFDIIRQPAYYSAMERKTLTLRMPPKLYNALSTLSGVTHRSKNDLISEAVLKFVAAESKVQARDLEKTLKNLRTYVDNDPGFEKAIAEFADAEAEYADPLEGQPYEVKDPVRTQVEALLTDG